MLEQIEWMEEQTTRDIHRAELADGIQKCFQFLGGRYIKIMVSKDMIADKSMDYRQCDEVLAEWTKEICSHEQEGFFIFTPLHFQAKVMGYACMSGIGQMLSFGLLEVFIRNICFSMENYIQKKRYNEINRHYQELFMTDQLTGLYNRFGLNEYGCGLYEKTVRSRRIHISYSVILTV